MTNFAGIAIFEIFILTHIFIFVAYVNLLDIFAMLNVSFEEPVLNTKSYDLSLTENLKVLLICNQLVTFLFIVNYLAI